MEAGVWLALSESEEDWIVLREGLTFSMAVQGSKSLGARSTEHFRPFFPVLMWTSS